jgi:outer membrane protein assembly factor BamA
MRLKKGDLFSNSNVESAFTGFNRLRQFRFVDIQFTPVPLVSDSNLLNCYVRLAPLNKQSTSFDIEGTNTSGNFGVAGNLTYLHRNLFRGAEVFQISLLGGIERMQLTKGDEPNYFNTTEFGVESSVIMLGPGNWFNEFERFLPKTVITLGFNYQRRPEYTRTINNIKFGYDWKSAEDIRHIWNILDYNKVNVFDYDPQFIEGIQDLYIKSSFTDHLIFAMNYSWIYNNQRLSTVKDYSYIKFNVEASGNLLWAISEITNREKYQQTDTLGNITAEYYQLFNTRFAQYIKSDIEYSKSFEIDKYNSFVSRAFFGIGIPYGNFDVLPFEKKYFTGGANGIRAWPVRSLGPGTYKAAPDEYPNQTADIKLEANMEYRFKLIAFIEGALFFDVGNIWAINEKDNRPGAQFYFNEFYKQIAVGTGAGLRFDMSYFILRLDLGMKMRDPSEPYHRGWIIGARPLNQSDFNLTFAIGYPF